MTTCDVCGRELALGSWPFCPHGRSALGVVPDSIRGGQMFENGFSQPRTFYSHSEHRAALAAEGYEIRAKNAGPDDKICLRWDSVDLDAARALVTPRPATPITVSDGDSFRSKDLDDGQ